MPEFFGNWIPPKSGTKWNQRDYYDYYRNQAQRGVSSERIREMLSQSNLSQENQLEIMMKLSPNSQSRRDEYNTFLAQRDWGRNYQPVAERYGDALEEQARRAAARNIAQNRMQAGYAESAGRGGGGFWNSVGIALMTGGMTKQAKAATTSERFEEQLYNKYMSQEDKLAQQAQMADMQLNYNMWKAEQMMNQASWNTLGQAIGTLTAFLSQQSWGGGEQELDGGEQELDYENWGNKMWPPPPK